MSSCHRRSGLPHSSALVLATLRAVPLIGCPLASAVSSEHCSPLIGLLPCRCQNLWSMQWSACRAPVWPRCCDASQHPRAWRSNCSGLSSSSACSAPWLPMPRPLRLQLMVLASYCTAHRCVLPPVHSACASCGLCSWLITLLELCTFTGERARGAREEKPWPLGTGRCRW